MTLIELILSFFMILMSIVTGWTLCWGGLGNFHKRIGRRKMPIEHKYTKVWKLVYLFSVAGLIIYAYCFSQLHPKGFVIVVYLISWAGLLVLPFSLRAFFECLNFFFATKSFATDNGISEERLKEYQGAFVGYRRFHIFGFFLLIVIHFITWMLACNPCFIL